MPRTEDASESLVSLAADVKRYIEDSNAALRAEIAALNKLRVVSGFRPYRLIEDRHAA